MSNKKDHKTISKLAYGEEPLTVDLNDGFAVTKALNWYAQQSDTGKYRGYLAAWAKQYNVAKRSDIMVVAESKIIPTYAALARIHVNNDAPEAHSKIKDHVIWLLADHKSSYAPVAAASEANTRTVAERVEERSSELIGEVEGLIDAFIDNDFTLPNKLNFSQWLKDNEVKPLHASRILEHCKSGYSLIESQLEDWDSYKDYYSWSKPNVRKILNTLEDFAKKTEEYIVGVKATRKPRKKKTKPLAEQVKGLKFMTKHEELGVESIDPRHIIGKRELWVFDSKYSKFGYIVSTGATGFGVKGTTVQNVDAEKSFCKKVRKLDTLKEALQSPKKAQLTAAYNAQRTKENTQTPRINENTILIQAF